MNQFAKHPSETYPIGIDYAGKAPEGASLVSGQWSATDISDNEDVSSSILASTTAVIDGDVAKCRVQSGVLSRIYRLGITAVFNTGDILHDTVYMSVSIDA